MPLKVYDGDIAGRGHIFPLNERAEQGIKRKTKQITSMLWYVCQGTRVAAWAPYALSRMVLY